MKNKILKSTLIQQGKNNELLITSIIIAFGINLLTSGILGFFNIEDKNALLILIGSVFSICVLISYSILKIKEQNTKIEIEGLIIYDKKNNKIIDIPEYEISKDMVNYLVAAFSENKALSNKWKSGEIGIDFDILEKHINQKANNTIIKELIEYLFLSILSTSLEDYYNINNIDSKDINTLSFDEMPVLLRKNRFLKLFSEDMDNREAFINSNKDSSQNKEKIVYAIGKKGAIFNKYNLTLPREVKIKKESINELEFVMKYFTVKIEYIFNGINTIVEREFYEYYLNKRRDYLQFNEFEFEIKISIEFNNKIIFSNKKMQNYMWLDKLLNHLIEYADINKFYNKINWENNKCIIRCLNNSKEEKKL